MDAFSSSCTFFLLSHGSFHRSRGGRPPQAPHRTVRKRGASTWSSSHCFRKRHAAATNIQHSEFCEACGIFKFLSLTSNFCISHNSENMRNLYTASRSHRLYAYPSWKTTLAEECLSTMERNACRGISAVEFSHAVLRSALTFICSTPAIIRSSFKSVFYSLLRNPFRRKMK